MSKLPKNGWNRLKLTLGWEKADKKSLKVPGAAGAARAVEPSKGATRKA